jgi:hypothetical protein
MRLSDTGGADVLFEKVFSRDIRISVVRVRVCVPFSLSKDTFTKRVARTDSWKKTLSVLTALFVKIRIHHIGKITLRFLETRTRVSYGENKRSELR